MFLLYLQSHALVILNIWDIYNARWYFQPFSVCIHKIYNSVQHFVLLIFLLVLQSPALAYIFRLSCTVPFIPLDCSCTRLLRFLSAIFLCSSTRNRAFPDNSPSLGNNWIRVTSRLLREKPSKKMAVRAIVDISHLKLRREEYVKDSGKDSGWNEASGRVLCLSSSRQSD